MKRSFLFGVLILALPVAAFAQTGLGGYNAEIYQPNIDGRGILHTIGPKPLKPFHSSFGALTQFLYRPVAAGAFTPAQSDPVVSRVVTDFAYAIGLPEYFTIGFDIPVIFDQQGIVSGTGARYETAAVGDIVFGAKVCALCFLREEKRHGWNVALASRTFLPTGSRGAFTGSSLVTQDIVLAIEREWSAAELILNGGYRFAPHDNFTGGEHDNDILFGLGARFPLKAQGGSWNLVSGVHGQVMHRNFRLDNSPVEAIAGFEKLFQNGITLDFGFGERFYNALGAPRHRAYIGIRFTEPKRQLVRNRQPSLASERILFAFDSTTLDDASMETLNNVAERLQDDGELTVALEGRACERGTPKFNMTLSRERTSAAEAYLLGKGIDKGRIFVQWFGEEDPLVPETDEASNAENRSVVVRFVR